MNQRRSSERLHDIVVACDAITSYVSTVDGLDGRTYDAVRIRLVEIGEAVKGLELALLDREPGIPWRQIAGMRDRLVHGYFDTAYSIVENTAREDVPQLRKAAERLLAQLSEER